MTPRLRLCARCGKLLIGRNLCRSCELAIRRVKDAYKKSKHYQKKEKSHDRTS